MARQAEAEREKRAEIIDAEGESLAAAVLGDASDILMAHPPAPSPSIGPRASCVLRRARSAVLSGLKPSAAEHKPRTARLLIRSWGVRIAIAGQVTRSRRWRTHEPVPASELRVITGAPHGCNIIHPDESKNALPKMSR
ncbi:MAG: hypothetical protein LH616_16885 [Ilumatobacteraceae bacterium]|nr:hypothetical protein [Ilumatobacteraceae bacterium]